MVVQNQRKGAVPLQGFGNIGRHRLYSVQIQQQRLKLVTVVFLYLKKHCGYRTRLRQIPQQV
ncbi:hypothetical protein D3C75_933320 [compost metagenome]